MGGVSDDEIKKRQIRHRFGPTPTWVASSRTAPGSTSRFVDDDLLEPEDEIPDADVVAELGE